MNIADLVQMAAENRKLLLFLSGHLAKHQTFSCVIQNRQFLSAHFLNDPVSQSSETQHVNIHNRMARMLHHKVHLGLHGELVGHDQQIVFLRAADGFLNDIVMQFSALSGAGSAKVKL